MRKKLFGAKDECRVAHKFSCVARGKLTSRLSDALDRPFASNLFPAIHFNTPAFAVSMNGLTAPTLRNALPNLLDIEFVQDYVLCTK
ncbi:hypothetical protein D3C76_1699450 [compost metagenome]